ncbi:MAG: hypothetical protein K6A43_04200 [Treponema sp.]|nr:hypothetical protein [Treponema sp.]
MNRIFRNTNRKSYVIVMAMIAAIFSTTFSTIFFTSCNSKKEIEVVHNPELESNFYGNWEIKFLNESELYSNPGTLDELYQGTVTFSSLTTISFFEPQRYTMTLTSNLESENLIEESIFTKEDLENQINQTITIEGTFLCDQKYLELKNEKITASDGQTYSAKDYSEIDPRVGGEKQVVTWTIQNNALELVDTKSKSTIKYNKIK